MKWVGILLACALVAAIGLGVFYHRVGQELEDIRARLVTEAQLEHPDEPETASGIKLAPIHCVRVYDLRADPIARRLRGDEIRALWARCEKIADMAAGLDKLGKAPPQ
ncbi:MAG: hypothetical protein ACRECX_01710 [Methyloceanibacter sp.]|uniref:hypothetical protein n=1 Tax=Methyloceanibacter sp. TaxID=1965321 RepID=UPI003D6CBD7A